MTLTKMQGVLGLFILLVIILIISPGFYNNLYNNILGRVVLISLLLFFATNNVTLGLLVALIIIIGTNMYFVEGLSVNSNTGTSTVTSSGTGGSVGTKSIANYKSEAYNDSNKPTSSKPTTTTDTNTDTDNSTVSTKKLPTDINGTTIGDDSSVTIDPSISQIKVVTGSKTISDLKGQNKGKSGVDRQSLEETMRPMQSNQISVNNKNFTSQDVEAFDTYSSKEGFVSLSRTV